MEPGITKLLATVKRLPGQARRTARRVQAAAGRRSVDISVVVPIYNGEEHLMALIHSLDRQSLGRRRFETIFVDDGSTDDSLSLLRREAQSRPTMRVATIPNSGWPGRPRNVGMDMARGRYVFFSDQDDQLFPAALECLVAMADRNDSDMVYGKIVRLGMGTPGWALAERDIERVDLRVDPIAASRTVHRLFRLSFIQDHKIRFLEGKVRLEDNHFIGQVLGCNPRASVLASTPCYLWVHRDDGTNTSSQRSVPAIFWRYYGAALQAQKDRSGDPDVLDNVLVSAFQQMFTRPMLRNLPGSTRPRQEEIFAAVSPLVREHFPARLDHRMGLVRRVEVEALRDGDLDALLHVRRLAQHWKFHLSSHHVQVEDGVVTLGLRLGVSFDGQALDLRDGYLEVPPAYTDLDSGLFDVSQRPADRLGQQLCVRGRESSIEWPVGEISNGSASFTPGSAAFGAGLSAEKWDLWFRANTSGIARRLRVSTPEGLESALEVEPGFVIYSTVKGNLSFDVTA